MFVADYGTYPTFGGGVQVAAPFTVRLHSVDLSVLGNVWQDCHMSPSYLDILRCHEQEGADVCQECDAAKPYTGSVQTTSAAGCWDEDFRSDIDMVIGGT